MHLPVSSAPRRYSIYYCNAGNILYSLQLYLSVTLHFVIVHFCNIEGKENIEVLSLIVTSLKLIRLEFFESLRIVKNTNRDHCYFHKGVICVFNVVTQGHLICRLWQLPKNLHNSSCHAMLGNDDIDSNQYSQRAPKRSQSKCQLV